MIFRKSSKALHALAATSAVAAALTFAVPSFADDAAPAAGASSPPAAAQPKPVHKHLAHGLTHAGIDAQIASMHQKLRITAAEETQFDAVAQVMRDNANSIRQLIADRQANKASMTAVDDLKSFAAIKSAEADAVNKLIPAFDALYNVLSDAQKKTADTLFAHERHRKA